MMEPDCGEPVRSGNVSGGMWNVSGEKLPTQGKLEKELYAN